MDGKITIKPDVQHGKPVICGTRVPVTRVLGALAGGMTADEIAAEYGISRQDVAAAVDYARQLVEREQHHILP